MKKKILIGGGVLTLAILIGGVFVYATSRRHAITNEYVNQKFGYSFKYLVDYNVYKISDGDGQDKIATSTEDHIDVKKNNSQEYIFGIYDTGEKMLNLDLVKNDFGNLNPSDIDVENIKIANQPGYKIIFKKEDKFRISDFYFVENLDKEVLKIVVVINSDEAKEMFESINFIK